MNPGRSQDSGKIWNGHGKMVSCLQVEMLGETAWSKFQAGGDKSCLRKGSYYRTDEKTTGKLRGVWGHRKACWNLNSRFHITTLAVSLSSLSSFQDLGVQYLLLLPSPIIKIAIRERANIDDLWFGENGRQTNISFYTLSQLQSKRHCFLSKKFQKSKWWETTSLSWQKASVIERISEFQSDDLFVPQTGHLTSLHFSIFFVHSKKTLLGLHHRAVCKAHETTHIKIKYCGYEDAQPTPAVSGHLQVPWWHSHQGANGSERKVQRAA